MFPADFQTVRDAGTTGPVSSDTEETTSLRAPSHDGPVPGRTPDEDEMYRQELDFKASARPSQSYHECAEVRHPAYPDNSGSLPMADEGRDSAMSGIDAMDDRPRNYNYQADGGGRMQISAKLRQQPSSHQSAAMNHRGRAAADGGHMARAAGDCGPREGRFQNHPVQRSFTNEMDQTHNVNQGALDQAIGRSDMNSMNLDFIYQLDETKSGVGNRSGSTGRSTANPSVNLSAVRSPSAGGMAHGHGERAPQQPLARGNNAHGSCDVERISRFNHVEHHQQGFMSRGPTPDRSPQRFAGPGRSVHGVSASPSRRPPAQLLSHLPRAPVRDFHRS